MISNSKLLKNKFIESISNEINHFSLMTKSVESIKSMTERINVSCFVCDYSLANNKANTYYTQIVDGNERNLINTLVSKSIENKSFKFFINGIVYLYDQTQTDTFSYLQSIHNELKTNYGSFVLNDNFKCIICDLKNAINLNENRNGMPLEARQQQSLLNLVDKFLTDFKNVQYITQEYEYNLLGSKPIEMGDNFFNVKINFDQLIRRLVDGSQSSNFNEKQSKAPKNNSEMILNIKTEENALRSRLESLNSSTNVSLSLSPNKKPSKALSKKNYTGDMKNNVRNGKRCFIFILCLNFKNKASNIVLKVLAHMFLRISFFVMKVNGEMERNMVDNFFIF